MVKEMTYVAVKTLIIFLTFSCNIEVIKLQDGITKVPKSKNFFKKEYREKYKIINLNNVKYNSIYIEKYYMDMFTKEIFDSRKGYNSFLGAIKFYKNGTLNLFSIEKKIDSLPILNPQKRGYRGISYIKNNDTLIDIIVPISDTYKIGKKTYKAEIQGDSLILIDNKKRNSVRIYIENTMLEKNLNYKSDW